MLDSLRPILGRLIGMAVGSLAVWLSSKLGIVLSSDDQAKITEAGVIFSMALFTTIYALVHKAVDHKINPLDSASPGLASPPTVRRITRG